MNTDYEYKPRSKMPTIAEPVVSGVSDSHGTLLVHFTDDFVVSLHRTERNPRVYYALKPYVPTDPLRRAPDEFHRAYQSAAFEAFFCGTRYISKPDHQGDLVATEIRS